MEMSSSGQARGSGPRRFADVEHGDARRSASEAGSRGTSRRCPVRTPDEAEAWVKISWAHPRRAKTKGAPGAKKRLPSHPMAKPREGVSPRARELTDKLRAVVVQFRAMLEARLGPSASPPPAKAATVVHGPDGVELGIEHARKLDAILVELFLSLIHI